MVDVGTLTKHKEECLHYNYTCLLKLLQFKSETQKTPKTMILEGFNAVSERYEDGQNW